MKTLLEIVKNQSMKDKEEILYVKNSNLLMEVLKHLKLEYLYDSLTNPIYDPLITKERLNEINDIKIKYAKSELIAKETQINAQELAINSFKTIKSNIEEDKSNPTLFSKGN